MGNSQQSSLTISSSSSNVQQHPLSNLPSFLSQNQSIHIITTSQQYTQWSHSLQAYLTKLCHQAKLKQSQISSYLWLPTHTSFTKNQSKCCGQGTATFQFQQNYQYLSQIIKTNTNNNRPFTSFELWNLLYCLCDTSVTFQTILPELYYQKSKIYINQKNNKIKMGTPYTSSNYLNNKNSDIIQEYISKQKLQHDNKGFRVSQEIERSNNNFVIGMILAQCALLQPLQNIYTRKPQMFKKVDQYLPDKLAQKILLIKYYPLKLKLLIMGLIQSQQKYRFTTKQICSLLVAHKIKINNFSQFHLRKTDFQNIFKHKLTYLDKIVKKVQKQYSSHDTDNRLLSPLKNKDYNKSSPINPKTNKLPVQFQPQIFKYNKPDYNLNLTPKKNISINIPLVSSVSASTPINSPFQTPLQQPPSSFEDTYKKYYQQKYQPITLSNSSPNSQNNQYTSPQIKSLYNPSNFKSFTPLSNSVRPLDLPQQPRLFTPFSADTVMSRFEQTIPFPSTHQPFIEKHSSYSNHSFNLSVSNPPRSQMKLDDTSSINFSHLGQQSVRGTAPVDLVYVKDKVSEQNFSQNLSGKREESSQKSNQIDEVKLKKLDSLDGSQFQSQILQLQKSKQKNKGNSAPSLHNTEQNLSIKDSSKYEKQIINNEQQKADINSNQDKGSELQQQSQDTPLFKRTESQQYHCKDSQNSQLISLADKIEFDKISQNIQKQTIKEDIKQDKINIFKRPSSSMEIQDIIENSMSFSSQHQLQTNSNNRSLFSEQQSIVQHNKSPIVQHDKSPIVQHNKSPIVQHNTSPIVQHNKSPIVEHNKSPQKQLRSPIEDLYQQNSMKKYDQYIKVQEQLQKLNQNQPEQQEPIQKYSPKQQKRLSITSQKKSLCHESIKQQPQQQSQESFALEMQEVPCTLQPSQHQQQSSINQMQLSPQCKIKDFIHIEDSSQKSQPNNSQKNQQKDNSQADSSFSECVQYNPLFIQKFKEQPDFNASKITVKNTQEYNQSDLNQIIPNSSVKNNTQIYQSPTPISKSRQLSPNGSSPIFQHTQSIIHRLDNLISSNKQPKQVTITDRQPQQIVEASPVSTPPVSAPLPSQKRLEYFKLFEKYSPDLIASMNIPVQHELRKQSNRQKSSLIDSIVQKTRQRYPQIESSSSSSASHK